MTTRPYNVLFLCTGNSARSIMAESILRKHGSGGFRAFSAGSHPKRTVDALALKALASMDYPTHGLRSKSWHEFAEPGVPEMDFVFTVCDRAAGETCPVWPGHPLTAHWGIEDPATIEGSEIKRYAAFVRALRYLKTRVSLFAALPIASLDKITLRSKLTAIGREPVRPAAAVALRIFRAMTRAIRHVDTRRSDTECLSLNVT